MSAFTHCRHVLVGAACSDEGLKCETRGRFDAASPGSTPGHGWRENVHEIAIVVTGVFIAIVGQQADEAWDRHQKVNVAEGALREELLSDDRSQMVGGRNP
jgi:hypothetical protein